MNPPNQTDPAIPSAMPDNPPAFPGADGAKGMTLRDWFAGQALGADYMGDYSPVEAGRVAYEIADAMLKAREVKP